MMEEGMKMGRLLIFFLSLLYIISPIDILPELFLGPLGFIDDIIVLIIGVLPMIRGGFFK